MFCTITPASYDLERLFHRENVFLKALVNFPYIKKNSAKSLPGTCQHYPLYSSFSPFSPYSYCTFPPLVYTTNASPCIGYKHRPERREVATQRVVTGWHRNIASNTSACDLIDHGCPTIQLYRYTVSLYTLHIYKIFPCGSQASNF